MLYDPDFPKRRTLSSQACSNSGLKTLHARQKHSVDATWLQCMSCVRIKCKIMAAGARQQASRAFVAVLLLLARTYNLILTISRDSSTEELLKAYRKLLLKTHPDKGGKAAHLQKLRAAKEHWQKAHLERDR